MAARGLSGIASVMFIVGGNMYLANTTHKRLDNLKESFEGNAKRHQPIGAEL